MLIAILNWDRIPDPLVMHRGLGGKPDGYSAKWFGSVFNLNVIQLLMTGMFMFINKAVRNARQHYYNPEDPAIVAGKRYGLGWTLNFAHPLSWFILGGIVLIPVLIAVLTKALSA